MLQAIRETQPSDSPWIIAVSKYNFYFFSFIFRVQFSSPFLTVFSLSIVILMCMRHILYVNTQTHIIHAWSFADVISKYETRKLLEMAKIEIECVKYHDNKILNATSENWKDAWFRWEQSNLITFLATHSNTCWYWMHHSLSWKCIFGYCKFAMLEQSSSQIK